VDIDKLEVRIFGIFSPLTICKRGLWGECKFWKFRSSKLALYYESIKDIKGKWRVLNV
jgi:hypothetical protein